MPKLSLYHFAAINIEKDAAQLISNKLLAALQKNKSVLLLLSGGSSIAMYAKFFDFLDNSLDCSNLTISLVDERLVKSNDISSNEGQLLASKVIEEFELRGAEFVSWQARDMQNGGKVAQEISKKYEKLLVEASFKIALLGLGPDGHTAGWLPTLTRDKFFKLYGKDELVTYYEVDNLDADNEHRKRLTSTIKTIRQMNELIFFASGENKREALERLLSDSGEVNQTPARAILDSAAKITILTDQGLT